MRRLRDCGIDALSLPLIGIAPVADPAPLIQAWRELPRQRLVVFVSPNAAEQFFARRPVDAPCWPASLLAGSPGPGTTRVLTALGVPGAQLVEPEADAAQFDSEALWAELAGRDWHGADVLIVRGSGGRDWLADTLRRHGARVGHLDAYRRVLPRLTPADQALLRAALAEPASHLWFFSSSEAVGNLVEAVVALPTWVDTARSSTNEAAPASLAEPPHVLLPPPRSEPAASGAAASGAPALPPGDVDWSRSQAIATHPRIAASVRQLGFGRIAQARPTLEAVVACIQLFDCD